MAPPEWIKKAVEDGLIWKCAGCDGEPENFSGMGLYFPKTDPHNPVAYALCAPCADLFAGKYGEMAKAGKLNRIEETIEREKREGRAISVTLGEAEVQRTPGEPTQPAGR